MGKALNTYRYSVYGYSPSKNNVGGIDGPFETLYEAEKALEECKKIYTSFELFIRVHVYTPPMTLNEYQEESARTASKYAYQNDAYSNYALGLTGEAGEVADHIKKVLFHAHTMDKGHLKKELGDCLWYLSNLAKAIGFTLEEVAQANIVKLKKRYPDGFSTEASKNRTE